MSSQIHHHGEPSTGSSSSAFGSALELSSLPARDGRQLCVRHKQMANQNVNAKLQKELDGLPVSERADITTLWSTFSAAPHNKRKLILEGILTMCCFSQLSHLSDSLNRIIRIDPFSLLPREVSLRILGYLDAISLGRAAQVSKSWKSLADDDLLWRRMCGQHIDRKCEKCGWGLPLLERRRLKTELKDGSPAFAFGVGGHDSHGHDHDFGVHQVMTRNEALYGSRPDEDPINSGLTSCHPSSTTVTTTPSLKRPAPSSSVVVNARPREKRPRLLASDSESDTETSSHAKIKADSTSSGILSRGSRLTRPWKTVYCERLVVERNWRKGRCQTKTLRGHTDGVTCLQYHTALSYPNHPVLITGGYDRTVRIWNLDTGEEVNVLRGHTRAVRALQFDQMLLFTGSMDGTVRMWNWRKGECLRVLEGHSDGVVSLHYNGYLLASGSADASILVRNFRTGQKFFLRGHGEAVNSVLIWDGKTSPNDSDPMAIPSWTKNLARRQPSPGVDSNSEDLGIDDGTMLFSASDDGTIKLWDLNTQQCIRTFRGHKGQVQSMRVLMVDDDMRDNEDDAEPERDSSPVATFVPASHTSPNTAMHNALHDDRNPHAYSLRCRDEHIAPRVYIHDEEQAERKRRKREPSPNSDSKKCAVLSTCSNDGTIRLWCVDTGRELHTLFGHIEGVWGVDLDALRLVSASHDRTIKVWDRESGHCVQTLVGHRGAVTSLQLSDDMIVSGSDDGDVMVWNFGPAATPSSVGNTTTIPVVQPA